MNKEKNINLQQPEERIASEVWRKLERGLKKADNRLFSIQFFVSNIAQYIGETFNKNDTTEEALGLCASIILGMGWELTFAMKQARVESIFTKFILEVAKDKVVFVTEPKDEIRNSYEANTSKILTPNKGLITETNLPS